MTITHLQKNPGKFTLQVWKSNPYILVDTGDGKREYPPFPRTVLESPRNPSLPDISDIILTHWYHDHVAETPFIPPRIHKFPLPASHQEAVRDETVSELQEDDDTPAPGGHPLHDLIDGQTLTLQILHCPRHTPDSISLIFPADRALFTGDTVLAQGTAVFEDLQEYLASLQKMLDTRDNFDTLYPGHGPVVPDGPQTIRMYIEHRLEREAQILALLRTDTPDGSWTTWAIVSGLYNYYPVELWEAAARGFQLHMRKLVEGKVRSLGGEWKEEKQELIK
ncbi:beta-lactamase-like protein [Russula dissimulans]|nr:beta-lactamase-like protein [Russula dissimulans]